MSWRNHLWKHETDVPFLLPLLWMSNRAQPSLHLKVHYTIKGIEICASRHRSCIARLNQATPLLHPILMTPSKIGNILLYWMCRPLLLVLFGSLFFLCGVCLSYASMLLVLIWVTFGWLGVSLMRTDMHTCGCRLLYLNCILIVVWFWNFDNLAPCCLIVPELMLVSCLVLA
jgi:hypothetical protein